jgi:hypothetical protein
MDKKKVTFAIVLFIILGLFVFAFANPLNDNDVQQVQNASDDKITTSPDDNSGAGLISDNSNNNNNSVNARSTRRNTTRNLDNTTTVIDNTVSLVGDISSAISELKNYRSDYVFTDDTDYKKVISDYTDKINNSNSVEDIVNNLNKGKDEVDILIKKDLDAYKDEAKKAVKEYAENLDIVSDYTELLDNFNKDVDDAGSKKEIDKLVEETKNALDELEKKDLADAKTKAIEEIKNYKTEEELDINEITDSKESTINNINNSESINDVNKSLEDGKKEIDDIISNKTFTVTFVTKDNKKFVRTVKYKESAVAPTFKDFDEKVKYKNVYYKFTQWDKEYTNVKSDLTVNAEYRITHMYARLFLLKDGYEIPEDRNKTVSGDAYEYVKTIRIAVSEKNKKIAIADQGAVVRTNTDKIVEDANKYGELPLKEGKYITYEWY